MHSLPFLSKARFVLGQMTGKSLVAFTERARNIAIGNPPGQRLPDFLVHSALSVSRNFSQYLKAKKRNRKGKKPKKPQLPTWLDQNHVIVVVHMVPNRCHCVALKHLKYLVSRCIVWELRLFGIKSD